MNWLSKSLALDLIAIIIDGLTKASNRIEKEPDPETGDWPPTAPDTEPTKKPEPTESKMPAPAPKPTVTLEEVRDTMVKLTKEKGRSAVRSILDAVDAPKLTKVPEDKLGTVLELAKKELAS
ncbi:hypothetical protein I6I10_06910 [Corynebacterium glucuronolyticum]|uniref:Uncharacterized protein n=1 Tax=Corynebacterium glucuronolyticum TaxID=39791 RepID=A0A7T4BN89_9CORY|nr:hypothetical protein [Corynebacterium glucuronolyticum]QQB45340.1 hypothetical protein I6I10_07280 [Corynebacterium glucuronolyticum]QQB47592.1 hypothetical protein I6I10_06910 [Corynebacterium glucuronolyticum]